MAAKDTAKLCRDRARQRARDYITEYKSEQCCADCKALLPYYCYDFDHVRGRKEFDLREAVQNRCSIARIQAEIAKCEVVCKNCHAKRTYKRNLYNNNEFKIPPV